MDGWMCFFFVILLVWFAAETAWVFFSDCRDPRRAPRGFSIIFKNTKG